jgi:hypothetical protein
MIRPSLVEVNVEEAEPNNSPRHEDIKELSKRETTFGYYGIVLCSSPILYLISLVVLPFFPKFLTTVIVRTLDFISDSSVPPNCA